VDVSNATVILIEHAERFGLAQLHQLRGRVGRGATQSFCLLVTTGSIGQGPPPAPGNKTSPARQRLEALVKSTDGFVIAEEDLRIRGPGEFFGIRQWGVPEFRAANLIRDTALLEQARREARAILGADPALAAPGHHAAREAMLRRWSAKLALGKVS
jgi:ATP-dependent DNA helicase RecG